MLASPQPSRPATGSGLSAKKRLKNAGAIVSKMQDMERKREERRRRAEELRRQKEKEAEAAADKGGVDSLEFLKLIAMYREARHIKADKPVMWQPGCASVWEQSSASKIRVCIRKRPMLGGEAKRLEFDSVTCLPSPDGLSTAIVVHEPKLRVDLTREVYHHEFVFDGCFSEGDTNTGIFGALGMPQLVEHAVAGNPATVFCFGQTGSGKTVTMVGLSGTDDGANGAGLYGLAAKTVFNRIGHAAALGAGTLHVLVSFYEIYRGGVFDLLAKRKRLEVRDDAKGQTWVAGLATVEAGEPAQVEELIKLAQGARATAATSANAQSSRSHAVLQVRICSDEDAAKALADGTGGGGKLCLVDLAGSERASDAVSEDQQTRIEGAEINKSLLCLKECIRALDANSKHTPFRGSKLTHVLKESFAGDARTVMIANVGPGSGSVEHTLNTLRYAARVKDFQPHSAVAHAPAEARAAGGGKAAKGGLASHTSAGKGSKALRSGGSGGGSGSGVGRGHSGGHGGANGGAIGSGNGGGRGAAKMAHGGRKAAAPPAAEPVARGGGQARGAIPGSIPAKGPASGSAGNTPRQSVPGSQRKPKTAGEEVRTRAAAAAAAVFANQQGDGGDGDVGVDAPVGPDAPDLVVERSSATVNDNIPPAPRFNLPPLNLAVLAMGRLLNSIQQPGAPVAEAEAEAGAGAGAGVGGVDTQDQDAQGTAVAVVEEATDKAGDGVEVEVVQWKHGTDGRGAAGADDSAWEVSAEDADAADAVAVASPPGGGTLAAKKDVPGSVAASAAASVASAAAQAAAVAYAAVGVSPAPHPVMSSTDGEPPPAEAFHAPAEAPAPRKTSLTDLLPTALMIGAWLRKGRANGGLAPPGVSPGTAAHAFRPGMSPVSKIQRAGQGASAGAATAAQEEYDNTISTLTETEQAMVEQHHLTLMADEALLRQGRALLKEMDEDVDRSTEEYVTDLEAIVKAKVELAVTLQSQLTQFKLHLAREEQAHSLMERAKGVRLLPFATDRLQMVRALAPNHRRTTIYKARASQADKPEAVEKPEASEKPAAAEKPVTADKPDAAEDPEMAEKPEGGGDSAEKENLVAEAGDATGVAGTEQ